MVIGNATRVQMQKRKHKCKVWKRKHRPQMQSLKAQADQKRKRYVQSLKAQAQAENWKRKKAILKNYVTKKDPQTH